MIQSNTSLAIIDNSGAKMAECIKVFSGYRRRYAGIGDLVYVTVKSIRSTRRGTARVKKGGLYKAVVIRMCFCKRFFSGNSFCFKENSAVLLTKQNKLIGTRIFGPIPKFFKKTKFLKLLTLSTGSIF